MSFIDKLKNVFFEEVEDDDEEELPQTFAKKVEISKKKVNIIKPEKEEKIKEKELDKFLEEEEAIKPKVEPVKNNDIDNFIEVEDTEPPKVVPMMFDDDDFQEDDTDFEEKISPKEDIVYKREERNEVNNRELYSGKRESYGDGIKNRPYSYTKENYYEEKEKKVFKPSPIISPIYGILDKNYRKEEVITKRETRISTSYTKPDLDSVRNKAFKEVEDKKTAPQKREHEDNKKKVYDVNNSKPHVNKVTLADAEEYYNDLGLAYNVDYSDASRTSESRSTKYSRDKRKEKKDTDDNLFDLIDSMYSKED